MRIPEIVDFFEAHYNLFKHGDHETRLLCLGLERELPRLEAVAIVGHKDFAHLFADAVAQQLGQGVVDGCTFDRLHHVALNFLDVALSKSLDLSKNFDFSVDTAQGVPVLLEYHFDPHYFFTTKKHRRLRRHATRFVNRHVVCKENHFISLTLLALHNLLNYYCRQ